MEHSPIHGANVKKDVLSMRHAPLLQSGFQALFTDPERPHASFPACRLQLRHRQRVNTLGLDQLRHLKGCENEEMYLCSFTHIRLHESTKYII